MTILSRRRGMNLLEMMIAITLFGGVVISLMSCWVMHTKAIEKSQDTLVATNLAESIMEDQMGLAFKTEPIPKTLVQVNRFIDNNTVPTDYYYEVQVVDTSGPTGPDLKEVTVIVTWQEGQETKETRLISYVYWQS